MVTVRVVNGDDLPVVNGVGHSETGARPGHVGQEISEPATMPIAIIGMSCRFPGDATSPEKLWDLCANARSAWSKIPKSRFNQEAWYHPHNGHAGTSYVTGGHFLSEDISLFDASFFNFSSEIASTMDPQVRMQLESVFEAFESAGIPIEDVAGTNTSVYAGTCFRDNHDSLMRDPTTLARFFLTGNGAAMVSNRVSHFFDLRGPSMSVDTGCSTTLTLLHLACQSLRTGDSKVSVVGGANALLNPDMFISGTSLGLLSAEGKCFAFDSRASGYGRGEGVATIIIKPLQDALRDGDPVRAVIRETAVNQDGKTPTLTSPSQEAQQELVRSCYRNAGLDPLSTGYVEAHGTGTQAGDTIEAGALGTIFGLNRASESPLYLGSVKTNIGHTEAASGLAGVIKIPRRLESWPSSSMRRASVNNFGYGGANAHAIIEDPAYLVSRSLGVSTNGVMSDGKSRARIFMLSAKDEVAARSMAVGLRQYLGSLGKDRDEERLLDQLAFTLGQRRSHFTWNAACPASSLDELIAALEPRQLKPRRGPRPPRLGFVFTGQGAQWHAMGRELIGYYPVFRHALQEADKCLRALGASWSLIDELMRDARETRVNEVIMSLPTCVAVQIALVRLLRSWGINPTGVTGHSSGEVGAAYAAGAISLKSAMAIVYTRGSLTTKFQKIIDRRGGMIVVGLGRDDAKRYISGLTSGKLVVACVNSPSSVTVSGDVPAIEELEAILVGEKVFARRIKVDAAYHSHHMLPIAKDYHELLSQTLRQEPEFGNVIFSSPTTGDRMRSAADISSPEHWIKNMVQPVEFVSSLRNLCVDASVADGQKLTPSVDMLVEVGPHGALAGPIRQTMMLPELKETGISYGTCLTRGRSAVATMHDLVCTLLSNGYRVDLGAVNFPNGKHGLKVLHDLPPYPWNHQVKHWAEPRINKALRNRVLPAHDLLGSPSVDSHPLAPTWRHIICPTDIPWVRDHQIQVNIIYPGAGYLCMAIEAARQIAEAGDRPIAGYHFRDVDIMKALVVPDTPDGVEVQLSLRRCSDRILEAQGWQEFQVYSTDEGDNWSRHCEGLISVAFQSQSELATKWNSTTGGPSPNTQQSETLGTLSRHVGPNDIYQALQSVGINHGPNFQNITAIRAGQGQSLCSFIVADTAAMMPQKHEQKHVLHPTTLDSVFQAVYSVLPGAGSRQDSAMIPKTMKAMFVSQDISDQAGHVFEARSGLDQLSSQGFESSVTVADPSNSHGTPVLVIKGLYCQSLGSALARVPNPDDGKLCFSTLWKPDLALMRLRDFRDTLAFAAEPSEIKVIMELRRAAYLFIHETIEELTPIDVQALGGQQNSFYKWMKMQEDRAKCDILEPHSSEWLQVGETEKRSLYHAVESASANGRMVCQVGRNLATILRRQTAPMELIMEGNILLNYYERALRVERCYDQIANLVELVAHKKPRARILEIGAGTGTCTQVVLEALSASGTTTNPQFAHYDFTNTSSEHFEGAQQKFADYGDLISYRKFNVENDSADQDFQGGSYDLVIASHGLHATNGIDTTMTNIRKLLKPGGKLLVLEHNLGGIDVQMVFGALSGWGLSQEPENKLCPPLRSNSWESLLQRTGFDGANLELHDCQGEEYYSMTVMMSTAKAETAAEYHPDVTIIYARSAPPQQWLSNLKDALTAVVSQPPLVQSLDEVDAKDKVCIFLGELEEPMLQQPSSEQFEALRALLTRSKGVLWVSQGGALDCPRPLAGLHTGLLRTLRCEDAAKRYVSLDLDPELQAWTATSVDNICDVFRESFDYSRDPNILELEYAVRSGVIQISRLREDAEENDAVAGENIQSPPEMLPFSKAGRDIRLGVATPGLLDSLSFSDDPTATEPLPDDFVEISPAAFGLNFRDVMVAMGQLNESRMGFECSGIISRVGSDALSHNFRVGDPVYAFIRGYFATTVRVHHTSVGRIPEGIDFETAASIPLVFITAYHALYDMANLREGESVLIHSGTGGVGQAATMLAQQAGAEIFVTVGSEEKQQFITDTYGVSSDHIFSSRNRSFADNIMAMTKGKGVDVVLNSLAGPLLRETWRCIAAFGRFVEIGKRDLELNNNLEMEPFTRSVSFASLDLITLGELRGDIVARVISEVNSLFQKKHIRAVTPITVFPISEAEKAFRTMQAGKHMGKLILRPHPEDRVKVLPPTKSVRLSPESSYLIIGGLGGIGRSISQWMIQRGARNLILLSRSAGSQNQEQESFLRELRLAGANVVVKGCDIANKWQLASALEDCKRSMPAIKGVIQGAMVLRDCIFEQMSLADYNAAVQPKVQGSWNLHELLSEADLDFFVMLSSISGFGGNSSQANYSAGGTFQDALARYRTARNLPAVSIDLGMVKSVGVVAESSKVTERLTKLGLRPLEEDEVLRLIEAAIRKPQRQLHSSQVVTGIPASFIRSDSSIFWNRDVRFSGLEKIVGSIGTGSKRGDGSDGALANLKAGIAAANTLIEAVECIIAALTKKLSEMFITPESEIDPTMPLSKFGVDSLVAVELRNWIVANAQADCSIFDVMQSGSLTVLAGKVAAKSKLIAHAPVTDGAAAQ